MRICVAVDDLHPESGWGCEGDLSVELLEEIYNEFGVKYTLFVPSNYHNNYPLSNYPDWVDFWKSKKWVELASHGHFHQCITDGIGEQEFLELDYENAHQRIIQILIEWGKCNYKPLGFRMPGWGCNQESANMVSETFNYVAAHDIINRNISFETKVFYGCDGIDKKDSLNVWSHGKGELIMFQSHIAGDWNDNIWSEENYENFRNILIYLKDNYDNLEFKCMKEL